MEAAGFAIGVVGLAGLFKSCIDLLSLVSATRSLARDYEIVFAKFELEKACLLQWARQVRLLDRECYDRRLDDPATFAVVRQTLSSVQLLMTECSTLKERYGLRPADPSSFSFDPRFAPISKHPLERFADEFRSLKIRVGDRPAGVALPGRIKWALTDKAKFETLVHGISHFVSKLHELFPDCGPRDSSDGLKRIVTQDLGEIHDTRLLRWVCDAAAGRRDVVAEAVVERYEAVCRKEVLELLWFRSMDDRRDGVAPAHAATFRWALNAKRPDRQAEWDDLSAWMRAGSGVYWISGKAGSGKSTLMKYIFSSSETQRLLQAWAGDLDLTVGSFFFWALGTTDQQSQGGISRAVLYHFLDTEPALIPIVLPRLWKDMFEGHRSNPAPPSPPSAAELSSALESFQKHPLPKRKFCFLIDGLDEFSGNYLNGVPIIKRLTTNPHIKVLVSSRPIPVCAAGFENCPKLRLQDLTRPDITRYVEDTVGSHPYMLTLQSFATGEDANPRPIPAQLVDKASGVFLWVILACRSVLEGFAAYDHVDELLRRVDELPLELGELFQQMLQKVDARYHEEMAKILKICYQKIQVAELHSHFTEPTVYTLSLAILDGSRMDYKRAMPLKRLSLQQQRAMSASLEGRLRSRCGGLLEVRQARRCPRWPTSSRCLCRTTGSAHDRLAHSTVEFIHRSVYDFLERGGLGLPSLCISDPSFSANAAVSVMELQLASLGIAANGPDGLFLTLFDELVASASLFARLCGEESADAAAVVLPRLRRLQQVGCRALPLEDLLASGS
ncbi:hypothetical protein GGTG_09786 [Gaeumannomyces tritici R3-111a-1]|uniref:Uncharacterized protein n=1 Tax=Gaeumannomyces tritici (strain R3-111a-1) TaxID=644352 RepID=J3P8F2_GAET3|nr:hypothetical protein GGTG_09786 [Gaeumannomyces tritici R3-111a-1]EJT72935.1 hypothetical protein GGTG_09786 [Gaeumannomyces tritici R3-111a-1]